MQSWLQIDQDVSELVRNWRWQEPAAPSGRYEQEYTDNELKGNDSYDPKQYNFSYSVWRKQRSYYRTNADEYYKDFIVSLMPMRRGEHPSLHPNQESQNKINAAIQQCVANGIPATHLLVGTLYSSYHLVSPYMLPTLKHLLTCYENEINYTVTSISNPRYTVAHIAAMSDDIELLEIFYNLGGNINVIDGASFSPLYIAMGKRNFKIAHKLLWMNAVVDLQQIIKKLSNFGLRHLMNVTACLQHFIFEIDIHINAIYKPLQQHIIEDDAQRTMEINNDIIQSIVTFVLPVQSYQSIKKLLRQMEKDEIDAVEIRYEHIMQEAQQCLSALIELKKQILSEMKHEEDDHVVPDEQEQVHEISLYPFGDIHQDGIGGHDRNFANKMILCNLFALSMGDGEYGAVYVSKKWQSKVDTVLCKSKVKALFQGNHEQEEQNENTLVALKWFLVASVVVGTAAICVRHIVKNRHTL